MTPPSDKKSKPGRMKAASVKCKNQYEAVSNVRTINFNRYFDEDDFARQHQEAHQRLLDVEAVLAQVQGRREYRIFEMAQQLLAEGLYQVSCANYRIAFFCLRSFLETSVAGVRFSAYEYELREWEAGRRDVSWTLLSGDETGCFSPNYANAFLPEIKDEVRHYQGLARRVYRECSEYVHGNPKSFTLTAQMDAERISGWFELFDAATSAVLFCFFVRYLKDISAGEIGEDLRSILDAELGHFSEIRPLIGGRGRDD